MVRKKIMYRTIDIQYTLTEEVIREAISEYISKREPLLKHRKPIVIIYRLNDEYSASAVFSKRIDDEEKDNLDYQGSCDSPNTIDHPGNH